MSKPVTIIDDLVFGNDPNYKLPLVNQSDWINQIDASADAEYFALKQATENLKNVIFELFTNEIPLGDKRNKLLVDYDARLVEALRKGRPYTNPDDKGIFDSYLRRAIEEELPGLLGNLPNTVDMCFLINTFGNTARYFGEHMQPQKFLERILNRVVGNKGLTLDHTLLAAASTVTDYATALNDGIVEMNSERFEKFSETAKMFRNLGSWLGSTDSVKILDQAIESLSNLNTMTLSTPSM